MASLDAQFDVALRARDGKGVNVKNSIKAASKRPLNQHIAVLWATSVPTKLKAMQCTKQVLDDRRS